MQITIIGTDKVYLWKIKPKNKNKRFFKINNQMYKALRSELTRLYRKKYDEWAPTDEVIIFRENRIIHNTIYILTNYYKLSSIQKQI